MAQYLFPMLQSFAAYQKFDVVNITKYDFVLQSVIRSGINYTYSVKGTFGKTRQAPAMLC